MPGRKEEKSQQQAGLNFSSAFEASGRRYATESSDRRRAVSELGNDPQTL
jgi:hypothetical protein